MSRVLIGSGATAAMAAALATPALAHPGDHHGLGLAELVAHLATPWHAGMLGLGVAAAVVLVLAVQRRPAKARRARRNEGDDA